MFNSRILGLGSYLPENKLTNADLEKMVDTNDQWIVERTGISERSISTGETNTDMGLKAAMVALEQANLKPEDLGGILYATSTPDTLMPNAACVLQDKIGAGKIMALDVSAACTGFVACLGIANQFIKTGALNNILIIGAERLSHFIDYTDRNTCILFGDGAGACVVGRAEEGQTSQIYSHNLRGEGRLGHLLKQEAGGSNVAINQEMLDRRGQYVTMNGREIFKNAVRAMSQCSMTALGDAGLELSDVDWMLPHQANERIIEAVAKHLGVSMEKVFVEIKHMGNTSAASIPICFKKGIDDGRIKRGQKILMAAFGGGLTSGSVVLEY